MRDEKGRFKKGMPALNKGVRWDHPMSEETKKKISETCKKRGIGKWMTGKKASEEQKIKIREVAKKSGFGKWMLGKKASVETRLKMSKTMKEKGDKNHLWNGGVTPYRKQIRESVEYKIWRDKVFERDDYRCIECGFRSGEGVTKVINADHFPITFYELLKSLIDQYGLDNIIAQAKSHQPLWDINNGRTLCIDCHRKTPTWGRSTIYRKKDY